MVRQSLIDVPQHAEVTLDDSKAWLEQAKELRVQVLGISHPDVIARMHL